jgi:hypothetical protein
MALEVRSDQVDTVVSAQLSRALRYRCLVFQSGDVVALGGLRESVCRSLGSLCGPVAVFEYQDQFDGVGALSCDNVLGRIETAAATGALVLAGPLHYLDYWSDQVACAFWRYLASFTAGPGIVVLDGPREQGIEAAFRLIGRIPGTDIRYLKSRLASSQDGLV